MIPNHSQADPRACPARCEPADAPRARYVARQWHELLHAAGERPIAIYGAGRHTRWLIESLRLHEGPRRIIAILDDERGPRRLSEIAGVPVRHPEEVEPEDVAIIIASSDSIEPRLAAQAERWAARATPQHMPRVARLYDGLPPGPYDGSHDEMFARLAAREAGTADADGVEDFVSEFTTVGRLPAAPERQASDPLPVPPNGVRSGYDGSDEGYIASGRAIARTILAACARYAPSAESSPRDILEWGCSSGRVLRHFIELAPDACCWGCDIDPWTINWAAAHLAPPLRFFRSTTSPSLPLPDASLDLVYAISVFTHLCDHFDAWLMELRRVLRPGGWLYVSINDEHVWARCAADPGHLIARLCPRLDFSRPLTDDFVSQGLGPHAQSFWHTRGVKRRWSFAFDIVEMTPGAIDGVQTGVLLRKPPS